MKKACFVLAVVLSLSACSCGMTVGEDKFSTSYVESHIVKGKTTQSRYRVCMECLMIMKNLPIASLGLLQKR
ncbi:hypothetical protein SGGMMB4_05178 [Sodalis glossinidius str. 'morsitans']|uniref:Lipoprotein n=1 Tax=Sodalis glossinidius (strain morsitans) TaxID=343509 RepID=A0A193QN08_SODGM|nr:hypothetical protein SGGMMB4_05178 [Sodalis glossinidius str. 'morsitans']